ncbi:MAG: class I SAM-dependent methyltransferase [Pseudomonadota bacterium]
MKQELEWPPLDRCVPRWTGRGFELGAEATSVLSYHATRSGWSEELTDFHEESAGGDHYIDVASRKCALLGLEKVLRQASPTILEVGCSSGFFLRLLRESAPHATVIGADFISGPLFKLASDLPDVPLLQFDLTRCPFEKPTFDAVVLLNVLEHIEDDQLALEKVYGMLKPGGTLVIEVPAGPALYDYYDEHLMHYRRYDLARLRSQVGSAGFRILKASHLGFFLYPPFWYTKKINRRKESALSKQDREALVNQDIQSGARNPLMHGLMGLELALGRLVSFPNGIRCLVWAEKPAV